MENNQQWGSAGGMSDTENNTVYLKVEQWNYQM